MDFAPESSQKVPKSPPKNAKNASVASELGLLREWVDRVSAEKDGLDVEAAARWLWVKAKVYSSQQPTFPLQKKIKKKLFFFFLKKS